MQFLWAVSMHFLISQDYMKMMKPYEESPADTEALKLVAACDEALGGNDKAVFDAAVAKLRAAKPKKNIENLLRSKEPVKRALAVMGHRLLPITRAWEDLRFMLMDSNGLVRWQVMLYASENPKGIELDALKMSLSDTDPQVRGAAIIAVAKVAKKPEQAAELFRLRWKEEKDPNVIKQLKTGFLLLGLPTPQTP